MTDDSRSSVAHPSRRHVLGAGAGLVVAGGLAVGGAQASAAPVAAPSASPGAADRSTQWSGYALPTLTFADDTRQRSLGRLYDAALTDLIGINTVYAEPSSYNQSGLLDYPPGTLVRAGGGYPAPQRWTRDAAVNAWSGMSTLSPLVARNTLYSVLDPVPNGGQIVQQDNQWWDQVVWIVSAWQHYLITGDAEFLEVAYAAGRATMQARQQQNFDAEHGLFRGPGFMDDGIAGYPSPPWEPGVNSSFVLDYPHADELMCLSTNSLYVGAYDALAAMASLAHDAQASNDYTKRAADLRAAIDNNLWRDSAGTYAYFVHGNDQLAGQLDTHQEGGGLALAVLLGVADARRTARLFDTAHWQPRGIVNVWPSFPRFSDDKPGRHNTTVWPMVHSMFGHAAAVGGRVDLFARSLTDLAGLVSGSDDNFYELYNSVTGEVDGGWQTGGDGVIAHNTSQPDQAWSASGYTRLIHHGLFGVRYARGGLRFAPSLPKGWGRVRLSGLPYREQTIDVTIKGSGNRVRSCTVDGRTVSRSVIDQHGTGRRVVEIEVG